MGLCLLDVEDKMAGLESVVVDKMKGQDYNHVGYFQMCLWIVFISGCVCVFVVMTID